MYAHIDNCIYAVVPRNLCENQAFLRYVKYTRYKMYGITLYKGWFSPMLVEFEQHKMMYLSVPAYFDWAYRKIKGTSKKK